MLIFAPASGSLTSLRMFFNYFINLLILFIMKPIEKMTKYEIARLIESLRPYLYVSEQYLTKSELIDWYYQLVR